MGGTISVTRSTASGQARRSVNGQVWKLLNNTRSGGRVSERVNTGDKRPVLASDTVSLLGRGPRVSSARKKNYKNDEDNQKQGAAQNGPKENDA